MGAGTGGRLMVDRIQNRGTRNIFSKCLSGKILNLRMKYGVRVKTNVNSFDSILRITYKSGAEFEQGVQSGRLAHFAATAPYRHSY